MPPFESVTASVGRKGCPTFAVSGWEGRAEVLFGFPFPSTGSRTSTGDGCLFPLEPRASDLQHIEDKNPDGNIIGAVARCSRHSQDVRTFPPCPWHSHSREHDADHACDVNVPAMPVALPLENAMTRTLLVTFNIPPLLPGTWRSKPNTHDTDRARDGQRAHHARALQAGSV